MPWRRLGVGHSKDVPEREEVDGMQVVRVSGYKFAEKSMIGRGINLSLLPFKFYQAARTLGDHDVALIYSPPLSLGITGWMLQRLHETPFVFNVQDIYPQTVIDLGYMKSRVVAKLFATLERFVYARAARLVMHSDGNVQYILSRRRADPHKTFCLPNWIDTETIQPTIRNNEFRQQHGLGDHFVVCYAGTMGYAQELSSVIDAAAILRNRKDIMFLLVGEGVRRPEFESRARGLANVRFLPLQSESAYRDLVADIDVGFVSLTDKLTTPVVPAKLLDFMAAARPVIACTNPASDTGSIVSAANCGFVCPPRDPSSIAAAVLQLRDNTPLATTLGLNGRQYAEQNFSLRACAAWYQQLFQQLCNSRTVASAATPPSLEVSSETSPTY
jgi:glycosyltransferase involved in cell wall biosynthesis